MKAVWIGLALAGLAACEDRDSYAADNTARNARDRDGATMTPIDQGESEADRALTQKVRQALMDDTALSAGAKNVKVISSNGAVTLRGPVASQAEKDRIDGIVRALAGVASLDNQLEIKVD